MKIFFLWTRLGQDIHLQTSSTYKNRRTKSNFRFMKLLLILTLTSLAIGVATAFLVNYDFSEMRSEKKTDEDQSIWETIGRLSATERVILDSSTNSSSRSYETATEHLNRARKLHYEDVNILSAISEYKKALEFEPNNPSIHYELAQAYLTQIATVNFAEAAIEELEKVISLEPSNINAYKDLALLYSTCHRADYQAAFRILEKGRELAPTNADLLMALGELSMRQGKTSTARAYIWEAHRLNPTDPRPYNAIGQTYYDEGRFDESIKYFKEALHLLEQAADEVLFAFHGQFSSDLQSAEVSGKLGTKVEERGW